MSKRFLRWVDTWIEDNIPPGANSDIESHEAQAERLTEKLFAEATASGFSKFETEEERERVPPLILAAVADSTDFDIDTYVLKSQLAMENEGRLSPAVRLTYAGSPMHSAWSMENSGQRPIYFQRYGFSEICEIPGQIFDERPL